MDAVVWAGGRGTRLRPLTDSLPKPLIPVAGEAPLLRLLRILPPAVDRVIIVVGYLEQMIREAVGGRADGREVVYVTNDPYAGTGAALHRARPLLRDERFLAVTSDDIRDAAGLEALCRAERGIQVLRSTATIRRESWAVEAGRVVGLIVTEVGEPVFMGTGAYVFGPEWFDTHAVHPSRVGEMSAAHALPQLFGTYRYEVVETSLWLPCGTVEEIQEAERALRGAPPAAP